MPPRARLSVARIAVFFRNTRPDDLLVKALQAALAQVPTLDPKAIEDIICGCAIPEGPQGLLPEPLKAGILAMVKAGSGKGVGG